MYISKILIEGFRNFQRTEVLFNEGINVVIGHNNAGKTNLLKAIALVLDTSGVSKRLDVDDFYKFVSRESLKKEPPKITISLFIGESTDEDAYVDEIVTVSNWLTKIEKPFEAQLTYIYFLPEKERESYEKMMAGVENDEDVWKCIRRDFIRKYAYKIFGGDPKLQNQAESENLQKFDLQFLNAIRDVERDMFTGKNTLLREVLQFFIDYEIKKNAKKSHPERTEEIRKRQDQFQIKVQPALRDILDRIGPGKEEILDYATQTGASFNEATPGFEGSITEIELLSALRLIVEQHGIKVPATHNGLGYNNLIFMSLLLAKMQANTDGDYYGSNAKVYPVLIIEEPEAHLHPSMQYKFLRFLKENKKKKVRQIFVTSHSTHITSAVSLDEIICLHVEKNNLLVGYPGKVFEKTPSDQASKAYVERFLDATKSNMLFAQKVILVEGISEQIIIPALSLHVHPKKHLADDHIEVINIGGRHFSHFLKLFDSTKPHTIHKQVACVTDRDPERKEKALEKYKKCYPFEFMADLVTYDYRENVSHSIAHYATHTNIRFFSQDEKKGKTLEYEIAYTNPTLDLLLTDSILNREEIQSLMDSYRTGKDLTAFTLRESPENKRIMDGINSVACTWDEDCKKKAVIASRYLNSISKGLNALELSIALNKDLESGRPQFIVPHYLKDCLTWLIQNP